MFQSPKLSMMGIGAEEGTPDLDTGINLRWNIEVQLGFPRYGFDLLRRNHAIHTKAFSLSIDDLDINPDDNSIDFGEGTIISTAKLMNFSNPYAGGDWVLIALGSGNITIEFDDYIQEFTIEEWHPNGTINVNAYLGSVPVASTTQSIAASRESVTIMADKFNRVLISFENSIGIYKISWLYLIDKPGSVSGWTLLGNFNLPESWEVAKSRISLSLHSKYEDGFLDLKEIIDGMGGEPLEYEEQDAGDEEIPVAKFTLYPVQTLLLLSLDWNIARMIGLGTVDDTAEPGVTYDYWIRGKWTTATAADHSWICFGLSLGTPEPVPVPSGLTVMQKSIPGALIGTSYIFSQIAAALKWDLSLTEDGLPPLSPVMYHFYRQMKMEKFVTPFVKITENKPVLVGSSVENSPPESYYIDGPLQDGSYQYCISGVDIFGRESELSSPVEITFTDNIPPPPPIKVKAQLDEDTMNVFVSWIWDVNRKAMAGDAKEFRVYYQTENLYPVESYISAISVSDETSNVTTELDPSVDYSAYDDGYIFNNRIRFKIKEISIKDGTVVEITVYNKFDKSGNKKTPSAYASAASSLSFLRFSKNPEKAAGRFLLQMNWANHDHWNTAYVVESVTTEEEYSASISAIPLTVSKASPVDYAIIGVNTVDNSGNIGAVSTPVMIVARLTVKPAAPKRPVVPDGDIFATRADYYGLSRYTVKIESESDLYYDILRSTDAALCYAEYQRTQKAEDLTDDELKSLSKKYADVFVSIGAKDPSGNTLTGTDGVTIDYTDKFPGLVRNRYLYSIVAQDKAGNRSEMSDVIVVKLYDVNPPSTPVITKILGGDRQITIQWAKNNEKDLAGYRIYRTDAVENAEDIRLMTLVKELDVSSNQFTDSVEGLKDYWYALLAVDAQLNTSLSSIVRKTRAYDQTAPEKPEWKTYERLPGGTAAKFSLASFADCVCILKRAKIDGVVENAVGNWVKGSFDSSGNKWIYSIEDPDLKSDVTYKYYALIKGKNGLTASSDTIVI